MYSIMLLSVTFVPHFDIWIYDHRKKKKSTCHEKFDLPLPRHDLCPGSQAPPVWRWAEKVAPVFRSRKVPASVNQCGPRMTIQVVNGMDMLYNLPTGMWYILIVCMYVYMYVCIYLSMYVCMYLCIYVSMYLCIYVSMYLCIYVPMYLCIYVSMYLCMHACMHGCMHACMSVCMYVCMYVCM